MLTEMIFLHKVSFLVDDNIESDIPEQQLELKSNNAKRVKLEEDHLKKSLGKRVRHEI